MRDAVVPLGVLLALGLVLRLIIAYVLLPGSGFGVDLGSFSAWAIELAQSGPWGLYDRAIFVDYTPGYLYVLWGLGIASEATGIAIGTLLKLPAIAADLALALAVFALAAELGASRRNALLATGVVLFVPITWFDSAVWSQVDAVGTLFLLLAVRDLWRGRSERAAVLTTIAAIIKPQFGILIPLAAVVIIRRHWVERPDDGSRLGGGPIRIATTTIAGLVTATLVCLPFGLAIVPIPFLGIGLEDSLLGQILQTAGGYPYVTVNAYNPWALVSLDGSGLASAGTWIRDAPNPANPADPYFTILGAPAVLFGSLVIATAIVALMVVLWRRHDDRRALLVVLAVMAIAFFILPTRVHERYLYPFFALGAILLALQPRWALVYGVLAAANFANMYGILTLPFYDNPGLGPLLDAFGGAGTDLGDAIRSTTGVWIVATAHTIGLVAAAAFLARPAPGETDRDPDEGAWGIAGATGPEPAAALAAGAAAPWPTVLAAASGSPAGAPRAGEAPSPTADGGPRHGPAVPVGPTAAASAEPEADLQPEPPAPFDRTSALAGEGGGRLDRLDLWLVLVLVLAALFLRTFRLGEPLRMHFDEVYHARTAIEFLQHWRYGEPHGIYEYTHPHLAKYAMAGGIVLFGDNEVVATSDLGTPVLDAAVEPRWDDPTAVAGDPSPTGRGGERLYVATGTSLDVHDLRTRERLASFPVPAASAVAIDPVARLVYVGTSGGEVLVFDTTVDAATLRNADATTLEAFAPTPFADLGGEEVTRLWVPDPGDYVVAATPGDGLVTLDAATAAELSRTAVAGRADVVDAGRVDALVASPADVPDPAAAAAEVVAIARRRRGDVRRPARWNGPRGRHRERPGGRPRPTSRGRHDGRCRSHQLRDVPVVSRWPGTAGDHVPRAGPGARAGLVAARGAGDGRRLERRPRRAGALRATGSELAVFGSRRAARTTGLRRSTRPSGCPARSSG